MAKILLQLTSRLFKEITGHSQSIAVAVHGYEVLIYVLKSINKLGHCSVSYLQNQSQFNTRNDMDLTTSKINTSITLVV